MTKPLEKRLREATQGELVAEILALVYQINHLSLADAEAELSPTILHVRVTEYFQNAPTIDKNLSLGGPTLAGITTAMLRTRQLQVLQELQDVLAKGERPFGGAA
jgi:hypothetical protein